MATSEMLTSFVIESQPASHRPISAFHGAPLYATESCESAKNWCFKSIAGSSHSQPRLLINSADALVDIHESEASLK